MPETRVVWHVSLTGLVAAAALAVAPAAVGCGPRGPVPLGKAIRPEDERQLGAVVQPATGTPREAFYAWKASAEGRPVADVAAADAALSTARNPFRPNDLAAISRGAMIYRANCLSCHGESADGRGPLMRVEVPKMNFRVLGKRMGSDARWFREVDQGVASEVRDPDGSAVTMPAFRDVLAREQIWLALTYPRHPWPTTAVFY